MRALAFILLVFAQAAPAAVVQYDFRGIVTSGFDEAGFFGPFGTILDGQPYLLSLQIDLGKGGPVPTSLPYSHGGSGVDSPLSVRLKIVNTYGFFDFGADAGTTRSYVASSEPILLPSFGAGGSNFAFSYESFNLHGYANTLTFALNGADLAPTGLFLGVLGGPENTHAFLGPAISQTVTLVPEPSTWALMLIGFGLAAAKLRSGFAWNHSARGRA